MMMDAPVIVAYSCSGKKRSFFEELARAGDSIPNLSVVPYESLGGATYHALIHKRTDDFVASLTGDRAAAERYRELSVMIPDSVVAVDNMEGIGYLVDRAAMAKTISKALERDPSLSGFVRNPRWASLRVDLPRAKLISEFNEFGFPVILKRRLACGTPESHMMAIAYDVRTAVNAMETMFRSDDKKDEYSSTVFVQEFVPNHGGTLFKLYAIGERTVVQARSSVQQGDGKDHNGECIQFDSQQLSRRFPNGMRPRDSEQGVAPMPAADLSRRISSVIRSELDLSLIGVDLIFDVKRGVYCVVDINYFPGYKGVENAKQSILLLAMEKVREKRRFDAANVVYRAPVAQLARALYSVCGDLPRAKLPGHMVIRQDVRSTRQMMGKGTY